jgi:hypothetical protein
MHLVIFDFALAYWLECSSANMQCYFAPVNSVVLYCFNQFVIKVQAGCRRRHCTGKLRIDGLVAFQVIVTGRTINVWGQWNLSILFKYSYRGSRESQFKKGTASSSHADSVVADDQRLARFDGFVRPEQDQGLVIAGDALQHNFNPAAGRPERRHPSWQYPGVIDDNQVTGTEQCRDIAKQEFPLLTRFMTGHKKAARCAPGSRVLGD